MSELHTEPITPAAREAVERLLDMPALTEEEVAESAIHFLLTGLDVESMEELHRLVEEGRAYRAAREEWGRVYAGGSA